MRIRTSDPVIQDHRAPSALPKNQLESGGIGAKDATSELSSADRTAVRQSVEAMTLDSNELERLAIRVKNGSLEKEDMLLAFVDMVVEKRFKAVSDTNTMASVKRNVLDCVVGDPVFGDRLRAALLRFNQT
jgi:hypothetical protein